MHYVFRSVPKHRCGGGRYQHHRSIADFSAFKHPRDRGLDHAVHRENHLKPLLNIKNLIKSEPTKSLPLSVISQQKEPLKIPTRPIDFIRKYPSIFEEFFPAGISIHPHIKLSKQVLDIDAEEQLLYQSETYRQDVANRVLKLLMISRVDRIPLTVLDHIKLDLGLPEDYVKSLVPGFPDCFRVIGDKNSSSGSSSDLELELVCWSDELSSSFIEKKVASRKTGYEKGKPIAFPMQFTKGFVVDKQLKKWYDEWQKLPYISPFENMTHLGPNTDESDKWAVGILHEILNLFVSKKVEKETLLNIGNLLGIRSRFKRALLHHPGIFYLSSKGGTYTVVLKEAYKRGLLIERSPMAKIRNQYAHLMNIVIEDGKTVDALAGGKQGEKKQSTKDLKENDDGQNGWEANSEDSDFESDDDEEEEDEEGGRSNRHSHRNARSSLSRENRKKNLNSGWAVSNRLVHKNMEEEKQGQSRTGAHRNARTRLSRDNGEYLDSKWSSEDGGRKSSVQKYHLKTEDEVLPRNPYRKRVSKEHTLPSKNKDEVLLMDPNKGDMSKKHSSNSKPKNRELPRDPNRKEMPRKKFHSSSQDRPTSSKSKRKLLIEKRAST